MKSQDERSAQLVETLANLDAVVAATNCLQEAFKNEELQIGFEETYQLIEKLAKLEFGHKQKLIQLTKA